MAVDGIIFDLDGTIIDTETPDYEVWQEFYGQHGLDLPVELWITRVGAPVGTGFDPAEHFHQKTGKMLDLAFQRNHTAQFMKRCEEQRLMPGVQAMFEGAAERGIRLAIASNSDRDWVQRWVTHHKLNRYFSCVLTRDDVKHGKPAPDLYLNAAQCLGLPVERCVAFEDSPLGMQAALAAGLRCIAVPNTLTSRLEQPTVTLTVSSLAEFTLDQLLAQF